MLFLKVRAIVCATMSLWGYIHVISDPKHLSDEIIRTSARLQYFCAFHFNSESDPWAERPH